MSNFLKRFLTGIVYVAIIVLSVNLHHFVFYGIYLVIMLLSLSEFYNLQHQNNVKPQKVLGITSAVLMFSISYSMVFGLAEKNLFPIFLLLPLFIMAFELYRKLEKPFHNISYTIAGLVYIALPFSLLPFLAHSTTAANSINANLVLSMFILVWANDTFAYLWGIMIGKRRLFPRISPKKSVEGFVGGLISTVLFSIVIAEFLVPEFTIIDWMGASIIIVLFATFGDLVESLLKRSLDVKDSSNLLPGHGGFLDRFDSMLFCIPAFYVYLSIV